MLCDTVSFDVPRLRGMTSPRLIVSNSPAYCVPDPLGFRRTTLKRRRPYASQTSCGQVIDLQRNKCRGYRSGARRSEVHERRHWPRACDGEQSVKRSRTMTGCRAGALTTRRKSSRLGPILFTYNHFGRDRLIQRFRSSPDRENSTSFVSRRGDWHLPRLCTARPGDLPQQLEPPTLPLIRGNSRRLRQASVQHADGMNKRNVFGLLSWTAPRPPRTSFDGSPRG
ncbi:hypothetical protein AWB74_08318 [Caballeronia arvi]|uniref:Uncharacterized protein n=1 Tax=Caballeronia arvi TaxID=1777135 RepID=A0A158L4N8_9BURK|nr:hypothetical protein AWB74_08318 [Caballeronia arvi]